ncbi:hypothetical protein PRR78_08785 [Klebsiella pneumoniae]|nr:hypothetical protein [Klebsiella pneumoniae]
MFFILAGVFMGVQLELNGTKLVVDTAPIFAGSGSSSVPRWSFSSSCCGRCSRKRLRTSPGRSLLCRRLTGRR